MTKTPSNGSPERFALSTTSNPGTALDVVSQDIVHLEKVLSDVERRLTRIDRVINIDEREAAVGAKRSETELKEAIRQNSELLWDMLDQRKREAAEDSFSHQYWRAKHERAAEANARLRQIKYLSELKKKSGGICSCGKHKAFRFLDAEKNVVAELCPIAWWISASRLAFAEGRLKEFNEEHTYEKYVKPYELT